MLKENTSVAVRQQKTFAIMSLKRFGVKVIIFIILLSFTGCIQYPKEKIFQFDYIQGDSTKYIFLNVVEYEKDYYQVISQEYVEEEPDFVITNFLFISPV